MNMLSRLITVLLGAAVLAGCSNKEPPARTVTEFVDNPILLEAAMVRCSRDRRETRYDPECVNAREAVNRIEAREEDARRAELEERSESKRRALRRMQEAQAEARRRAEETQRLREEAEYLAQFGALPPSDEDVDTSELPEGNAPIAVVPETEEEPQETPTDLQDIREELQRRSEEDDGN